MGFCCLLMIVMTSGGCGEFLRFELVGLLVEQLQPSLGVEGTGSDAGRCAPTSNRCGPPGLGFVVPDCPLGVVCFFEACNEHDICYGTCGTSRAACDGEFFEDLGSICSRNLQRGEGGFTRCLSLTYVYWQTSVRFGQGPFDHAQRHACACHEVGSKPVVPLDRPVGYAVTITPFDDVDDDLLPDRWEVEVGLDPTNPIDAWEDSDLDGAINLAEFIWDTDPLDPNPNHGAVSNELYVNGATRS